jgi:hypothetical protein
MKAWHFTGDTLRDGTPIPPPGFMLRYDGPLVMCESGFHASRDPFDALQYAPGDALHLVECGGEVIHRADKLVCSQRMIIASMDAEPLLRYFARMQALSVAHLWEPPDIVLDYLMTGDEALMDAAWAAAWGPASASASAAARAAAWGPASASASAAASAAARGDAARAEFNALVRDAFADWLTD